ncbi:cytosine-purine permease [Lactarius hatsudake]|nr:cytosine-purine permease [Lactarius hatsudake]KAH9000871.1 cytosine-purine permease [Lactarius hatsudake]
MLEPVGKFGKVFMVFVGLSMTGNNVPTIYSFGMCFQTFIPSLVVVPRYVFSVVATAVRIIPLSIAGQHKLYSTLSIFLSIIGYWAGAAALTASALSFALVVPSMDQVWYNGPIALTTGDIGIEMAMAVTTLLYVPLRHLEKRWKGV